MRHFYVEWVPKGFFLIKKHIVMDEVQTFKIDKRKREVRWK